MVSAGGRTWTAPAARCGTRPVSANRDVARCIRATRPQRVIRTARSITDALEPYPIAV